MDIDPRTLSPADRYKLLIGAIIPRPIAFVSTCSPDGHFTNLAPFSFFNGASASPMVVLFCPANRPDGGEKDTLRNAKPPAEGGQGEFVINIVHESFARAMAACAEPLPYGESEFAAFGFAPVASTTVRPPRVGESPLSLECRTLQVVRLAPGVPGGGNVVMGEVLHVHAHAGVVSDRLHVDPARLGTIGRAGGKGYVRTTDRFEMPSGREAQTGS
jgi:flavin reductase (DIM6/NTAB) family NADH-FMN oxidoreductase RutF